MNLRNGSRKQSCLEDNSNILSSGSDNMLSVKDLQIMNQIKSNSSKIILRKRNKESNKENNSIKNNSVKVLDKENATVAKVSSCVIKKNQNKKCLSNIKCHFQTTSDQKNLSESQNITDKTESKTDLQNINRKYFLRVKKNSVTEVKNRENTTDTRMRNNIDLDLKNKKCPVLLNDIKCSVELAHDNTNLSDKQMNTVNDDCKKNLQKRNRKNDLQSNLCKLANSVKTTDENNDAVTKLSNIVLKNQIKECKVLVKDIKNDIQSNFDTVNLTKSQIIANDFNIKGKQNYRSNYNVKIFKYVPTISTIGCKNYSLHKSCPIWKQANYEMKQKCNKRKKKDVYDIGEDEEIMKEENDLKRKKPLSSKRKKCEIKNKPKKKNIFKAKNIGGTVRISNKKVKSPLSVISEVSEIPLCKKCPDNLIQNIHTKKTIFETNEKSTIQCPLELIYKNQPNEIGLKHADMVNVHSKTSQGEVILKDVKDASVPLQVNIPIEGGKIQEQQNKNEKLEDSIVCTKDKRVFLCPKMTSTPQNDCNIIFSGLKTNFAVRISEIPAIPHVSNGATNCTLREKNIHEPKNEISKLKDTTNYTKYDRLFPIPKMTSTPDDKCNPCNSVYAKPKMSFAEKMSEIPAIPNVCNSATNCFIDENEMIVPDTEDSQNPNLFNSPIKTTHKAQSTYLHQKQLKMDCFVKKNSKYTQDLEIVQDLDLDVGNNEDQFVLFKSPKKTNTERKLKNNDVDKVKKPKKSYDKRQMRRSISKWKNTEGAKKETLSKQEENKLIKSLSEHFSELENFQLCID